MLSAFIILLAAANAEVMTCDQEAFWWLEDEVQQVVENLDIHNLTGEQQWE